MKLRKDQLTERQRLFCEFYVGPGKHNAALAARLAGYAAASSHVTGCQLLQKPKVAATVRGLEAAAAVKMGYTRERLIAELLAAVDMARIMGVPSTMVSGLVAIGKAAGLYAPEKTIARANPDQSEILAKFSAMSDRELLDVMAKAGSAGESILNP